MDNHSHHQVHPQAVSPLFNGSDGPPGSVGRTLSTTSTASSSTSLSDQSDGQKPVDGDLLQRVDQSDEYSHVHYEFWSKVLASASAMVDLPTNQARSSREEVKLSETPIQLDPSLAQSLNELALERDTDLGVVIMAGWSAVLARLSGQDDIIIGFRSDIIGQCVDALPLRVDLSCEPSFSQLLGRVQEMVSSIVAHNLPLHRISEVAHSSRGENAPQLYRVVFQWQDQANRSPISNLPQEPSSEIHADLELHLERMDNEVTGVVRFSSALFDPDTIKRHVCYLTAMLRSMVEDITRPFSTVDILSLAERRLLLETWNETSEAFPDQLCYHQMFELQADKAPNATAVVHEDLPLTTSGKVDRKALPAPDDNAFDRQGYEEPQGETEVTVALIWSDLLNIDRVGRNDNFFSLGGHSLIAIQLIERLRRIGLTLTIRALFNTPTLGSLVQSLEVHHGHEAPPNLIMSDTTTISPEMLPLIDLTQNEIDHVIKQVPGGVANIQDIYSLSPLQEGILFHHQLATMGDPSLIISLTSFDTRDLLDRYLDGMQKVVDRHDILRTAVVWEQLSTPAQVVWHHAPLSITELQLDPADGPIKDQLMQMLDPRQYRIDLSQAPLLRHTIAQDINGQWLLVELLHHLIGDNSTLELMSTEIKSFMNDHGHQLPSPQPFRNLIAQEKLSNSQKHHETFFTEMLSDIDTPSLPFGLRGVHGDGDDEVTQSCLSVPLKLSDRLRKQARLAGVSVASLCHLAWAMVISRACGEDRVVYGTVLSGRIHSGSGADSTMGLFINTLPLRVDLAGSVRQCVYRTHDRLAALLEHEHASLMLAQRCSSIPQGTPLFSAMLNYRHIPASSDNYPIGSRIKINASYDRTNYPLGLSVDDYGSELDLTLDVVHPHNPERICGYMQQALQSLTDALDQAPDTLVNHLEVIPEDERHLQLYTWNSNRQEYPAHQCIHQLFEQHAELTPQATALVFMDQTLTYGELNMRANQLAHHLIELGVRLESRVAICVDRSIPMIVGVLGVLKAGGAYVPLDPKYASERLGDILDDADPMLVLVDAIGRSVLGEHVLRSRNVVDVTFEETKGYNSDSTLVYPSINPIVSGLTSNHLAYIIFTSGSTGKPKGVMIEHQGVVNMAVTRPDIFDLTSSNRVLMFFSFAFDGCVMDIISSLCLGGSLHILPDHIRTDSVQLWSYLEKHSITRAALTPAILEGCLDSSPLTIPLTIIAAGEAVQPSLIRSLQRLAPNGGVVNGYGPTEATIGAIIWRCPRDHIGDIVPIGRPIANKTAYLLDKNLQLVPIGVEGELYIGGVGVARGYLNRPDLTAQVFVPDPFARDTGARMYKTGDMARYLPDGNLVFLGRNDHQVKIRGFRVELGEIEARLSSHSLVDKVVVVAVGQGGNKQLVGYVVAKPDEHLVHTLRSYLATCLPNYMIPAAFVRLDDMPLTSNGKVDRRRLPEPDMESVAHQAYEATHGDVEDALLSIWRELLHIDRIGRHDNFFMLGGHSLLVTKMVHQIKTWMGFKITLNDLFAAPTIAELVPRLLTAGSTQEDSFDVLLPIKSQGSRLPLFCIHHGFGLCWTYISLLKYMHPDQPMYGLQMRGLFDNSKTAESVEEMALDYIDQIRRIQPRGPYSLLGYSFGGMVAHTMAAILERQGDKVALLGNMDSIPMVSEQEAMEFVQQQEGNVGDVSKFIQLFANRVQQDGISDTERALVERVSQIVHRVDQLVLTHSPLCCQSGMILFRAMIHENPSVHPPISPDIWKPYVMGKIEVYDIDSDHQNMDQPAPSAEIGRVLSKRLDEIHAENMKNMKEE